MKVYVAIYVREDWSYDLRLFPDAESREDYVQRQINNPYNPRKKNYYIYEEREVCLP